MAKPFPGRKMGDCRFPAGRITTEDEGREEVERAVARTRIASRSCSRIEINPCQNETREGVCTEK